MTAARLLFAGKGTAAGLAAVDGNSLQSHLYGVTILNIHVNFGDGVGDGTFWPGREDLSAELGRLLASAQDGGSTVAECYMAARRIRGDSSWHREWKRLADTSKARADAAIAAGSRASARSNWLRAINYYLASAFPFEEPDRRRRASIAAMRECARQLMASVCLDGELVRFPWMSGCDLAGYLVRPPGVEGPLPIVICLGEPGHHKEEFLFKLARHATDRGVALLALDLMGEGEGNRLSDIAGLPDLESAIARAVDHLCSRDDIDSHKIAVLADNCGSSFVARGIAADPRIAAAVCDGGIWDLHERAFLASRAVGKKYRNTPDALTGRVARNIGCPLLITVGEQGWLKIERINQMVEQLRSSGRDITLKVFESGETAAAQGHVDNPTLASEFAFDWLAARLGIQADPA